MGFKSVDGASGGGAVAIDGTLWKQLHLDRKYILWWSLEQWFWWWWRWSCCYSWVMIGVGPGLGGICRINGCHMEHRTNTRKMVWWPGAYNATPEYPSAT
jgi:hypothetical protein